MGRWPASASSLAWFLELPFLVPIARLSYSIYLLQFIPMFLLETVTQLHMDDVESVVWAKWLALCSMTLVVASLMSAAVYMCAEKPCMNLRERCGASKRAA